MKKYLKEAITDIRKELENSRQLKSTQAALYWIGYIEKQIDDPGIIMESVENPVLVNGRWVSVTEQITPLDTFSDDEIIAELKKRMNRISSARA